MMDARSTARVYRSLGYIPFPLLPNSKEPPRGTSLTTISHNPIRKKANLGIFAGSPNGLVIIDADSPEADEFVTGHLKQVGLYDWTTIVLTPKRKGHHFWLRILDVPESAQAYYKLPREVGGGEFRVRHPAYVVAPPSIIPEGEYTFVQGGMEFFTEQPVLPWASMSWLIPAERLAPPERRVGPYHKRDNSGLLPAPRKFHFRPQPHVLRTLQDLAVAAEKDPVYKRNYKTGERLDETFASRSEAEFSVVMGLIMSGWGFSEIEDAFEDAQPGHYKTVPNPARYLTTTYNNVMRILAR